MSMIQLDEERLVITVAGKSIALLPKEFALFTFLYKNHGRTFTRDSLLNHVWPLEEPVDRTVDDHVYRLRKKLKEWDSYFILETVRGIGYRLHLPTPSQAHTPSLKDEHFQKHFSQLLTKYHLFGQGEALQTLAGQQQILGAKLDPFYEMYTELLKGNWSVLLKESIPFWERAYFMVILYGLLEDNPENGKQFIEILLAKNKLPLPRQWELRAMDLPFFQCWCGEYEKACKNLSWAAQMAEEHQLEGFKLAIHIEHIFPLCMTQSFQAAVNKADHIEKHLQEKPYLRELSYFNISKGLCHLTIGELDYGNHYISEGLAIMQESKFALQYLHVLTHLKHTILFLLGENHSLTLHYKNLRSEMIKKYNGDDIKKEIYLQINSFL